MNSLRKVVMKDPPFSIQLSKSYLIGNRSQILLMYKPIFGDHDSQSFALVADVLSQGKVIDQRQHYSKSWILSYSF